MFKDTVEIYVKGGNGGHGCISFLREKFRPYGGPDGGKGGKGGSVFLEVRKELVSFNHLQHSYHVCAPNGQSGRGKNQYGKDGQDVTLLVPLGTLVLDAKTQLVLKDLVRDRERLCIAQGGRGGRGNKAFATSVYQAPRQAEKGQEGEERTLQLEVKLMADVGLIGFPNAGKSTLLSRLTPSRPKIADYPFTTIEPYVGILAIDSERSLVLADIPGIIEGASQGRGLGIQFLRHMERTRLLIYLLDLAPLGGPSPDKAFQTLRHELQTFRSSLYRKPFVVVGNKLDLPGADTALANLRQSLPVKMKGRQGIIGISALTGMGLSELASLLLKSIK